MWSIRFITLTVLFSICVAVQNFQGKDGEGRDDSLLRLLTGNGLYNPLDPTGFILEGNKKQYTGNGIDTPRFDPDNYAYKYSGASFGSAVNQFFPSFMNDNSINNSPNYKQSNEPSSVFTSVKNASEETGLAAEKNGTDDTRIDNTIKTFSALRVESGSNPLYKVPDFLSQTFPDNLFSALKTNASSMFPDMKFSGQPGMLGIGSQVQPQVVTPDYTPVQNHQFLSLSLKNVSETHISSPTYNHLSEIGENKQETSAGIKVNISDMAKPIYTGYPGMLGVGQMFPSIDSSDKHPKLWTVKDNLTGYQNTETTSNQNISGQSSGFDSLSVKAGVNTNDWKGEWPGKSSDGGDWSGDWSEKWPKSGNIVKDDKESTDLSKSGGFTSQQSQTTDWDGSWPVSSRQESTSARPSNNLGNLAETMTSLKKLLDMLSKLTSSVDNSSDEAYQRSFSQMVSGWKEEMKP